MMIYSIIFDHEVDLSEAAAFICLISPSFTQGEALAPMVDLNSHGN
jgi:hypothetical protein